ncbi:MAG: type II toxin-antitoxin system RelE/ParE family toxin, partial [Alphaproteobacteria bacterium]|nr:type II toxin-antitoxin system RelE/ParE family toxin [Alphaproteobacteria bacterium]
PGTISTATTLASWGGGAGVVGPSRIPPSHRLEALSGNRRGQHSIRINDQWRVCFHWTGQGAVEIEIVDYH